MFSSEYGVSPELSDFRKKKVGYDVSRHKIIKFHYKKMLNFIIKLKILNIKFDYKKFEIWIETFLSWINSLFE